MSKALTSCITIHQQLGEEVGWLYLQLLKHGKDLAFSGAVDANDEMVQVCYVVEDSYVVNEVNNNRINVEDGD